MGHGAEVVIIKTNNAETPRYPYTAVAWWDWASQRCRKSQKRELCSSPIGASLHKWHQAFYITTRSVLEEANAPALQDFWQCRLWQTARGALAGAHHTAVHGLPLHGGCKSSCEVVGRATRLQMDRLQRIEKHHGEFKVWWVVCQNQQSPLHTKSSICTPWRIT